jgi:hypothetical protein
LRHRSFGDYCDKQKRESIRQLTIVKQLLEHGGMSVDNFLETDSGSDPYIFCHNPSKNGSFDGIRIYKIGDEMAFRVQKESKTHPYGAAYPIPIIEMFSDFLTDKGADERKAGKKVIDSIVKEVRRFFDKSVEAERDERSQNIDQEGIGNIISRMGGTDYSALIFSKGN